MTKGQQGENNEWLQALPDFLLIHFSFGSGNPLGIQPRTRLTLLNGAGSLLGETEAVRHEVAGWQENAVACCEFSIIKAEVCYVLGTLIQNSSITMSQR